MDRLVLARGVADDFVIHVGDVHHVLELMAALPQEPAQNVYRDKGAEIADMAVVVDGEPACIHADCVVHGWLEFLDFVRERVVEMKWQSTILKEQLASS